MNWTDRYSSKVWSLEQAAGAVRSGDLVFGGMPEPTEFLVELGGREDLEDVVVIVPAPRVGGVAASWNKGIEVRSPFLTALARSTEAPIELLPLPFSAWPDAIGRMAPRVRVVQVATPLDDGTVHPGASIAIDNELIGAGRRPDTMVIALVHPGQPHVHGRTFHVDDFDVLVELPADTDGPMYDDRVEPEGLEDIAAGVMELVPDGATLQAGVGGISEAVVGRMTHLRDIGIHTEVLGAGLAQLAQSGAVTNANKALFPHKTVATIALPDTYDFIDENPDVHLETARIVLDPSQIARNPFPRCINSAVEVDLFGQVNAEMIGGTQFSGVGGQLDFLRACGMNPDGLAITVLPSTARGGETSRIVMSMGDNAVTATRYDSQVVVTEHGVAWLQDATVSQRAERLIAVADPAFRDRLKDEAGERGLLRT